MTTTDAPAPSTEEKVNILIVDDLPEKHLVLQSVLEELGQNIVSAYSGRDALRLVLEQEFAVILLDVNMPDIDGFETAALIRKYRKTAKTPILFISAYIDDIRAMKGYSLGAVDYISSPVVPEIMRSKVRVFVELHLLNQQLRHQAREREALIRAEAAQATAEEASRRAVFLAQASQRLSRSIEFEPTVRSLFELMVPELAGCALLSLHAERGGSDRLATQRDGLLHCSAPPELPQGLRRVIEETRLARQPRLITMPSNAVNAVSDRQLKQAFNFLGSEFNSAVLLPLVSGHRAMDVLTLAFVEKQGPSQAAMLLLSELASRASFAMENAFLYKAIQDADKRKNEFLAMLAHELRNPLAPIRNAVHVLEAVKSDNSNVIWAKDLIGRQIDQMSRIVDDLLDVSRIASGKIGVEKTEFQLRTVIDRAVETSLPVIKAKNQHLTIDVPSGSVVLHGDLVRLAQVLSNLLNNAAKFTPENGQINLHGSFAEGTVAVSVKDTGQGISAEFLPHVFELFAQATQAMDRSQGGLGIGLTLVRHLVEMHGGTVKVSSDGTDRGAEFTITLPAKEARSGEAQLQMQPQSPVQVRSKRTRTLVVDDLAASADSLMKLLEMMGHEVQVASSGPHALEVVANFPPDVVLLDIGLPGMDGFEVARRMRQCDGARDSLLIALTGYGEEALKLRAVEAGFDHYFVKPANIEKLLEVIEART